MKELSIFEKLKVLVDVSSSSGLCIASLFIIIFLAVVMLTTNKKNKKSTKIFFGIVYLALLVVMLIQYWESLSSMFDYMMNNFFISISIWLQNYGLFVIVVYFPNLAIYLAAIIATNIILWKTIFSKKQDKVLKIINVSVYSLIHYLLVLILNVVSSNKLNVFDYFCWNSCNKCIVRYIRSNYCSCSYHRISTHCMPTYNCCVSTNRCTFFN